MQIILLKTLKDVKILNNDNLKALLYEYSKKRDLKVFEADNRKQLIYEKNPRLSEIEKELSDYSISTAKILLNSNSPELLKKLNNKIANLKAEKEKILKSLNIDSTYFLPDYDCKICNDTGYVTSGYKTTMCLCLKQRLYDQEYNSINLYNMQNQTFNKFNYNVYSDVVNKSEYNSDISPLENIKNIRNICNNFIKNFDDPDEKNLLFFGKSGVGKTFLSSCIANELIKNGKTVLYQTAPIMLDSIIDYRLRKTFW